MSIALSLPLLSVVGMTLMVVVFLASVAVLSWGDRDGA